MPTTLKTAITQYLRANNRARTTRSEYRTTLKKWTEWGNGVPIEELGRKEVREFLDWVYERAVSDEGTNPGRTSNKARDHIRAIVGWAWEQDLIDSFPRFPRPKPQRDIRGRHYLTKAEINALYFATHKMKRPKGWKESIPVGKYWRAAIVLFFNYELRRRYWNSVEVSAFSRTDSLAPRLLGSRVTRPRDQAVVALGLAILPTR